MKSEVNHTTFRNDKLFCTHCGGELSLVYPMSVTDMVSKTESFNKLHKNCKPTWTEPKANMQLNIKERMDFWHKHGEQGMSSMAMFQRMSGMQLFQRPYSNHPLDPDDFKRCYKLLEAIPEWKQQLHIMRNVSDVWDRLIDNWDKLTELYEDMIISKKANGMYELMQNIINNQI